MVLCKQPRACKLGSPNIFFTLVGNANFHFHSSIHLKQTFARCLKRCAHGNELAEDNATGLTFLYQQTNCPSYCITQRPLIAGASSENTRSALVRRCPRFEVNEETMVISSEALDTNSDALVTNCTFFALRLVCSL